MQHFEQSLSEPTHSGPRRAPEAAANREFCLRRLAPSLPPSPGVFMEKAKNVKSPVSTVYRWSPSASVWWVAKFLALAFLLHWAWETVHAAAYVESAGPLLARARHCLPMAAVDAAWTLGLYVAVTAALALTRLPKWSPGLLAVLALAGIASATAFEMYALATGRWTYNAAMPLVPPFQVGLWPVLQMAIVTPLVARVAPMPDDTALTH